MKLSPAIVNRSLQAAVLQTLIVVASAVIGSVVLQTKRLGGKANDAELAANSSTVTP